MRRFMGAMMLLAVAAAFGYLAEGNTGGALVFGLAAIVFCGGWLASEAPDRSD